MHLKGIGILGDLMRRAVAAVVAVVAVLAAGCSSGGDDPKADTKPSATASSSPAAAAQTEETAEVDAPESAAPALSTKWGPKLEAAGEAKSGICKDAGAKQCVDHITKLTELVYDVDTAIDEADAAAAYPKAKAEIAKVEEASESYVDDGCAGSGETTLGGSACGGYVAKLLVGPANVQMTMTTDELTAAK